jgi:predicted MFS family arabinose efflux permease
MVTLGNILSSAIGGPLYDALPVRSVLLIGVAAALMGALLCHVFTRPAVRVAASAVS